MKNILENIKQIEQALKEIKETLGISIDNDVSAVKDVIEESEEKENKPEFIDNTALDDDTLDIEYLEALGDAQYLTTLSTQNNDRELCKSGIVTPEFAIGDNVTAFLPQISNNNLNKYIFGNKWITKEQAKDILPGDLDQSFEYKVPKYPIINGVVVGIYPIDSTQFKIELPVITFNDKYILYNILYEEGTYIWDEEDKDQKSYCVLVERNYLRYSN